jgi:hypothetical protein
MIQKAKGCQRALTPLLANGMIVRIAIGISEREGDLAGFIAAWAGAVVVAF